MSTKTRFEKEAKGNSEMAYSVSGFHQKQNLLITYKQHTETSVPFDMK